jgi:hypothetical protein
VTLIGAAVCAGGRTRGTRAEVVLARVSAGWLWSGGGAGLVDEPAEDRATPDLVARNRVSHLDVGRVRRSLVQAAVGSVAVVVLEVFFEKPAEIDW